VEEFIMVKIKYIGLMLFSLCFLAFNTYAKEKNKNGISKNNSVNQITDDPSTSVIDVNNITTYVRVDGLAPQIIGGQSFNGQFPKGSQLGAIYAEGFLWGGIASDGQNPAVRVGGAGYTEGNFATSRLFRVRPDYQTANLSDDAANFFAEDASAVTSDQIQQVKDQYAKDWQEWPGNLGAPYDDVNKNGQYDPDTDIPGVPGASQTLWISYNDSQASSFYASPPIGMQVQETFWAYAVSNALGNVIFKKVRMVYTGTSTSSSNSKVDSLYLAQFADPDVGTYTDDYAGCDTTLSLGYAYNSTNNDQKYSAQGLVPPAVGYDFLQGASYKTGDPNDSAIVNFKYRKGYKYFQETPMSNFIYFAAGGNWSDPTAVSNNGNYNNGTLQYYNLLRGYLPSPEYPASEKFPTNTGGEVGGFGTYLLSGDPVTGSGWVDGQVETAGDRRILCINGPISLSLGDTAEIVLALIGGEGTNNLSSVSVLKYNDQFAQFAYDQFFNIPIMPQPSVEASAADGKVVLNWGSNQSRLDAIENSPHGGFDFQAYTVYQLPAGVTDISKGERVATFDLNDNVQVLSDKVLDQNTGLIYTKPIIFLKNEGIKRYIVIDQDAITRKPLINGQSYTFAVTALGYNNDPGLPYNILESAPVVVNLTPHSPNPGTRYAYSPGDTIMTNHSGGKSDGLVFGLVVDPSRLTGDSYKVSFDTANDETVWSLTDVTKNTVVVSKSTNQSGDDNYLIIDGMQVKVIGPAEQVKSWDFSGTRWVSGTDAGLEQFFGGLGVGKNFFGSDLPASNYVPVELRWVGGSGALPPSEANGWSQGATYWRSDGYAYHGPGWLPFTAWDVTDPANPKQINASFVEDANAGSANNQWDMGWDGSAFKDLGGREYLFINNTPYDPTHYNADVDGTFNDVLYAIWPAARGSHPYLEAPWTMEIVPNYVNVPSVDEFTFTAPAPTTSTDNAKADVNMINVFPNPYYGYQYRETSRQDHYVTFSHLPSNATIRIFDLAGVLVRTIKHNSTSQFEPWDLRNDNNYPVASGIYVAYVDMPDLGTSKILKLAVIQETQVLPIY
jgi:hypothetical protein